MPNNTNIESHTKRNKKKDKAIEKFSKNGKYTQKSIRIKQSKIINKKINKS